MSKYWLFKSEPDVYGIDDLSKERQGIGRWDGIRNYQARNFLRDQVQVGDEVFVYHSQCKVPGVAGIARVVKNAYPDPAQFDPESDYFDPKASPDQPRWYAVDVQFVDKFAQVVPLKALKQETALEDMVLLKQGRLSVQPVKASEWQHIVKLAQRQSP
ncbi:EVE domain-containing protein [Marinimicrobium sp. ABcell2]|uniref:EVE domain-containing protein n=1 Tax=Marinimicrobium sp. ABcell2 TaxID=3069751 RepID=UPI0027B7E830|nr:EVE domain-containing protein [Marinimicrobium sp. ABcell2]MDQ2077284.1 EVE domain-containing protein [Marinimicrobium sp. ABcell2]